jgi:hypothetical protein
MKIPKQLKATWPLLADMAQEKEEKKQDAPPCCAGCIRWQRFGKNCFYYWELKKHCTMWSSTWDESMAQ